MSPDIPPILYGTAWKEDATEALVAAALAAGFRGIDTANQRRHYNEAGVGAALAGAFASGIDRGELFIQTKFTYQRGQDHRLPYDPAAPVAEQVRQSFASSLEHLGVDQIDSLVLHGPSTGVGLGPADREAWASMEELAESGAAGMLGVSNVTAEQLSGFVELARTPVAMVQNRCYADRGWDREVREICAANGICYQGFSLLTANRQVLADPEVAAITERRQLTVAQLIFRFAIDAGMLPLTGTTSAEHMAEDLAVLDAPPLEPAERELILGRR